MVQTLSRDWIEIPQVDEIYHLATYGNMYHHQDRKEIFMANLTKTFDLLETTKDMNYKKLLFVSSSAVELPMQTLYSACKKACEDLITAYNKPVVIVRPYSITGVGEQKEHLIPTLIDAAFTGRVIPFVLEPVHDFIDVSDVVEAMIIITSPGLYHLGSGKSYSNAQVKKMVEDITRRKIEIKEVSNLRTYDEKKWLAPNGIWAKKTLIQSIKEMVDDYQQRFKA